jgi:hypothetical protein
MKGDNDMPDGFDIAQRGGPRGGGPRGGFPRRRFPRRFPIRRFPRFRFYPIYYGVPRRCDYRDRYGRCCDYYGNCYYDYYGGGPQLSRDDSIEAWSPSESWDRMEAPETDYGPYDQY